MSFIKGLHDVENSIKLQKYDGDDLKKIEGEQKLTLDKVNRAIRAEAKSNNLNLSIICSITGFSLIGINGFGKTFVNGAKRSPLPPAIITTDVFSKFLFCFMAPNTFSQLR